MGIASSASSFAALTRCALQALSDLSATQLLITGTSGSAVRIWLFLSLFMRLGVLGDDRTMPLKSLTPPFSISFVLATAQKNCFSSEAHRRVCTSPSLKTPLRAAKRLEHLLAAMHAEAWDTIFKLFRRIKDMHQLFETASPLFLM